MRLVRVRAEGMAAAAAADDTGMTAVLGGDRSPRCWPRSRPTG